MQIKLSRLRQLIRETYYNIPSGAKIKDVVDKWSSKGDKLYDDDVHAVFPAEEVWPYHEYTWSRDSARRSPDEWDELYEAMKKGGWSRKKPAVVLVGKNGKAKVGEGNHRLAMAMELGIDVPVVFEFRNSVD